MKIEKLKIKGFRGFIDEQECNLNSALSLIYGQNSHGKTSLAEAIEFLLCGKTARRDLVAITKTEFVDSLRNANYDGEVYIEAWIKQDLEAAEQTFHVKRKLVSDYPANNGDCVSELSVESPDGTWTEFSFQNIGMPEWQTPDSLPIIFQHTLRYISSAKPSDRLQYFRELLDIGDISRFREAVRTTIDQFSTEPTLESHKQLVNDTLGLSRETEFVSLSFLTGNPTPTPTNVDETLIGAIRFLLEKTGTTEAKNLPQDQITVRFGEELAKSRQQQSRLPSLAVSPLSEAWVKSGEWEEVMEPLLIAVSEKLKDYESNNAIVNQQLQSLFPFLKEAVGLEEYSHEFDGKKDCYLCLTKDALSWSRIQEIKSALSKPGEIQNARINLNQKFNLLETQIQKSFDTVTVQIGQSLMAIKKDELAQYIEATHEAFVAWSKSYDALVEKRKELISSLDFLVKEIQSYQLKVVKGENITVTDLPGKVAGLKDGLASYEVAITNYRYAESNLSPLVNQKIDELSGRANWSILKKLWENKSELYKALIERCAKIRVKEKLDAALIKITSANADVIKHDKYPTLSHDIEEWWKMLRPDEPVSFSDVRPKGQGLREIDIKAILVNEDDPSLTIERNAVAIFSDSQLNCLGLSVFLARTNREGIGFIVFDDPIQSLDREHADFLTLKVFKRLIEESKMQVVVITHDRVFWDDMRTIYATKDPRALKVEKVKQEGARIIDIESTLADMLGVVDSIQRVPDPNVFDLTANKLRTATEIFCKYLICKNEPTALYSSLEGKMLPDLIAKATPYLILDPSHSGKLKYIESRTNKGSHDAIRYAPGETAIRVMHGDLTSLSKDYELLKLSY